MKILLLWEKKNNTSIIKFYKLGSIACPVQQKQQQQTNKHKYILYIKKKIEHITLFKI